MEVSSHALALRPRRGRPGSPSRCSRTCPRTTSTSTATWRPTSRPRRRCSRPSSPTAAVVNLDDPRGAELARATPRGPDRGLLADRRRRPRGRRRRACASRGGACTMRPPVGGRFNAQQRPRRGHGRRRARRPSRRHRRGPRGGPPVPGRFEPVDEGQPFTVLVDYAHTPGAPRERARRRRGEARRRRRRRSSCSVPAATGTPTKRPEMGEVASRLADRVVLTSDNPRGEDPAAIIDAVRSGMADDDAAVIVEPDRRRRHRRSPSPRPSPATWS